MNETAQFPGANGHGGLGQCSALTSAGQRCRGRARSSSGLCPFHDPALAEALHAARVKGGRTAARRAKAGNLEGLDLAAPETALAQVAGALVRGAISEGCARELRGLIRARLEVVDVKRLSERLDVLEGRGK